MFMNIEIYWQNIIDFSNHHLFRMILLNRYFLDQFLYTNMFSSNLPLPNHNCLFCRERCPQYVTIFVFPVSSVTCVTWLFMMEKQSNHYGPFAFIIRHLRKIKKCQPTGGGGTAMVICMKWHTKGNRLKPT